MTGEAASASGAAPPPWRAGSLATCELIVTLPGALQRGAVQGQGPDKPFSPFSGWRKDKSLPAA